jgi:DNA-directed RNA polymerase specialized sigma24 family protein
MKESELVKQAQKGDKKALAQLVKNHEQTIYNFAFKICRDKYGKINWPVRREFKIINLAL